MGWGVAGGGGVHLKLDVQGQGSGKILDLDGQGGGSVHSTLWKYSTWWKYFL